MVILARDPAADGTFYYSVRTTGVYCRPSCAARQPLRENVRFHATCADAEQAGFRPCKRCRPEQPSSVDRQAAMVVAICRYIEQAEHLPSLDELAQRAQMSPSHFHRVFTSVTGLTPRGYAVAHRATRVRFELARDRPVTEALYQAGFNSSGRFYEASNALLGMTPSRLSGRGCTDQDPVCCGTVFIGGDPGGSK